MIGKINLNFDWKYSDTFKEEYLSADYKDKSFKTVNIPHANKEIPYNNFDEEIYQFISCYRKHIVIDEALKGKKLVLEFEAVANAADVYINGQFAFSHKGSYTAFSHDITDLVKYGEENIIAVKVDSTERDDIPPFGNVVDYLVYGGIYREVYIYVHEDDYISNMLLTPVNVLEEPQLEIDLKFNRDLQNKEVLIEVSDNANNVVARETKTLSGKEYKTSLDMKGCILWSNENPYLYTVKASIGEDSIEDRVGMRSVKFTRKGFFLNGKKLKIRGLNRHQSYPYVGYAMPASAQIADADFLKYHLGVNLARTSHYPNSKHFLNRCDEIGLLVFTEIPGWQFVSQKKEWRDMCLQHVEEMIIQDYNHPSIILWGVRINESGDDDELYTRTNALAHSLDKSRQTSGVRCIPQSHLLEDVYSYNDFIHAGGKIALLPKFIVCSLFKPLLISEHNGHMFPTKTFDHEKKRQEHALRHARVLNAAYKSKGHAGAIGWCMSDYNTHKDFGSGDKICYHGVSDMFRIDKLAANTYKIQQKEIPVLEISSNMEIGDTAGGQVGDVYIFTNCDEVRMSKNGVLVNTFDMNKERKKSEFKYLPCPPTVLSDIIGNQIENSDEYHFTPKDAKRMKKALLDVKKYGTVGGILHNPFTLLKCLVKYKLSVDSITTMYGKFVTSWGGKQVSYKFEGYINGEHVITVEKGAVSEVSMAVKTDKDLLVEKDTYDVTRIEIKAESQYGNVLPYDSSIVNIETNGIVEVIGPKTIALIGGQRAFWVKTVGKSGDAKIKLSSPTLGDKEVNLVIKKEQV